MDSFIKDKDLKKIAAKVFFIFLACLMYIFFGLSFVVGKKTLNYVSPLFLTASRMFVAAVVLLVAQGIIDKSKIFWPKGVWKDIFILSIFNIFFTNALEFWGLQYLPSYKTCYLYSICPFLAALFSYIFLKEKLSILKFIGLAIALIGFMPLILYKEFSVEGGFYLSLPEIALLGAAVSTIIGWITMRKLVYKNNFPLLMANSWSMFIGGIASLISSLLLESWHPVPVFNFTPFLIGMLIITLINNIIGYNLYAFFVKKFTVTLMAFIGFMTPLVTAFIGWIYLGEKVSSLFFVSYGIVFLGLILFSREELVYNVK